MAGKNAEYERNFTALQCFNLNLSFFQWPPSLPFASSSRSVHGIRTLSAICATGMLILPCFHGIQFILPSHLLLYSFPHKIIEKLDCWQMLFFIESAYIFHKPQHQKQYLKHYANNGSLNQVCSIVWEVCRSRYSGEETAVIKEARREVRRLFFLSLCFF